MYSKHTLLTLFIGLSFIACNGVTEKTEVTAPINIQIKELSIDGKYSSIDGDIQFTSSKDKTNTHFNLMVVSSMGKTGEAEGDFTLNDDNTAQYKSENCTLNFKFQKNSVMIKQNGTCDMGLNVSATASYKKS